MSSSTPSSAATAKMIDKADVDGTASTVTATPCSSEGRTARNETDESTATDVHMDICERLTAVEAALRLQLAAGTSHLQEIEMAPGAFGLSAAARPAIKAIRKRRNAALHVVGPGQVVKLPSRVQDFDAERAKTKDNGSPLGKFHLDGIPALSTPASEATKRSEEETTKPLEEETIVSTPSSACPTLSTPSSVRPATKGRPGQVVKLPPEGDMVINKVQTIMAKIQSIKDGDDHEFQDAEWAIAELNALAASLRKREEGG